MGAFQIAGGGFGNLHDPQVSFGGPDVYGVQGNRLIYGPYVTYMVSWDVMNDSEYQELIGRIDGLAGQRTTIALSIGSSTSWTVVYGNVKLISSSRRGNLVYGVTVELSRVSATA